MLCFSTRDGHVPTQRAAPSPVPPKPAHVRGPAGPGCSPSRSHRCRRRFHRCRRRRREGVAAAATPHWRHSPPAAVALAARWGTPGGSAPRRAAGPGSQTGACRRLWRDRAGWETATPPRGREATHHWPSRTPCRHSHCSGGGGRRSRRGGSSQDQWAQEQRRTDSPPSRSLAAHVRWTAGLPAAAKCASPLHGCRAPRPGGHRRRGAETMQTGGDGVATSASGQARGDGVTGCGAPAAPPRDD